MSQDVMDLLLILCELQGYRLLHKVAHGLFVRVELVEPGVSTDSNVAVENIVTTLLSAHQLQIVGELLKSICPLGRLAFLALAIVFE